MPGTRFTHPTAGARYRDRYWRELETVEALRPLAAEAGMSMTQMAVAWVLENPVVTAPIVGASRRHLREDCRQLAKTAGEFEGGSPTQQQGA
jgi:1-deoxyxylulose-5-phosphate synthase